MNIEILQQHIASVLPYVAPELKEDGSNLCDFFCADVVGNRRFAQNYGGYPRSEIAEINAQVSMQQAVNLLNDLTVYEGSYQDVSLTPEEIMLSHKSKYIQAPSEMIDYIDNQLAIKQVKFGQNVQLSQQRIDFAETSNPESND